jgi:hypothetical protein
MDQNEFRIVRILSDQEFVINGGSDNDIELGQAFKIVDPEGNPIKDLDDEIIGYLGAEKGILYADDVRESLTILKTKFVEERTTSLTNPYTNIFNSTHGPISGLTALTHRIPAHYQRANIDPSEMEPLEKTDDPIHKGDLAIAITND